MHNQKKANLEKNLGWASSVIYLWTMKMHTNSRSKEKTASQNYQFNTKSTEQGSTYNSTNKVTPQVVACTTPDGNTFGGSSAGAAKV